MRLSHSRMSFIRAYLREAQEMLFDAHDKAFAFYRGACQRGIYDNMKTAVDAIFVGKERAFNRRFLQMMSHYLVEPTPCTPGGSMGERAGREPGEESAQGSVRAAATLQVV
jgi:transposase